MNPLFGDLTAGEDGLDGIGRSEQDHDDGSEPKLDHPPIRDTLTPSRDTLQYWGCVPIVVPVQDPGQDQGITDDTKPCSTDPGNG